LPLWKLSITFSTSQSITGESLITETEERFLSGRWLTGSLLMRWPSLRAR